MLKKPLFVCGCPRSGTTAMGSLLAGDPRIVLGIERYGTMFFGNSLTPDLFERERFLSLQPGDTFYRSFAPDQFAAMQEKFDTATYVGDKIPYLYRYLARLDESLPGAKVIGTVRNIFDVAASYEARARDETDVTWSRDKKTIAAVDDWSASVQAFLKPPANVELFPVVYEEFFTHRKGLDKLYAFLELDVTPEVRNLYTRLCMRGDQLEAIRTRDLSSDDVFYISQSAPFGPYRQICKGRFTPPPGR